MPKFDDVSDEDLVKEHKRLLVEGKPIHAWPLGREIIRRGKEEAQTTAANSEETSNSGNEH